MDDVAEAKRIVDALIDNTRRGKVTWTQERDGDDDSLAASTDRFFYALGSRDFDGRSPWQLEVWRHMKTEEAPSRNNIKVLEVSNVERFAALRLGELVDVARQSVAGIYGSLADEVLKDLSS